MNIGIPASFREREPHMSKLELTYDQGNAVCVPFPYALALALRNQLLDSPGLRADVRAMLAQIPVYEIDDNGEPIRFLNHYECEDCGQSWSDAWSATSDDKCSGCGKAFSPYESEDIEPEA